MMGREKGVGGGTSASKGFEAALKDDKTPAGERRPEEHDLVCLGLDVKNLGTYRPHRRRGAHPKVNRAVGIGAC